MLRIDSKYTYHGSIGESCPWASLSVTGGSLSLPHGGSDVDLEYDKPTTNRPEPIQRSMGANVIVFSRYDTALERPFAWESLTPGFFPKTSRSFEPDQFPAIHALCAPISSHMHHSLAGKAPHDSYEPGWPRPKRGAVCCGDFRPWADLILFHPG
jgi:hypothetical protein